MWDLPGSGIEPLSPAWAGRFFTTGPLSGVRQMNLDRIRPSVHRNANSQMKAQTSANTTSGLCDTPQHRCPAGWYFNDALKRHFQGTYSSEIPGLFVQETIFLTQSKHGEKQTSYKRLKKAAKTEQSFCSGRCVKAGLEKPRKHP